MLSPAPKPRIPGLFLLETAISLFIHINFKGMWYRRLEMMLLIGKKDIMEQMKRGVAMEILMIEDNEAVCEMMAMFLKMKAGKLHSNMTEKKAWKHSRQQTKNGI